MSDRALYRRAAEDLRRNPKQWEAYNSTGHCVMLAGPGSGKTKTLTIKLAKLLFEEVEEPRGVACITYNNDCAKELEQRLDALGVEPSRRVFIGTVHSFSLTQIILPYAKSAGLALPDDFRVATIEEQRGALERAFNRVIEEPVEPSSWRLRMDVYRRSFLNRDDKEWHRKDPATARLVEAYEEELRKRGLIDFDDMPLLAVRALSKLQWLQRAILAKYPVLIVDEYQDLGIALHQMVMGLCFSVGIRLFAVGDGDQSIYGFTGAKPDILKRLSERDDVQTVQLQFNYRCGSKIVLASQYALGEERNYCTPEGTEEGVIYFYPSSRSYQDHADYLFSILLPDVLARNSHLTLGNVAVLYPTAWIGDNVFDVAQRYGFGTIRTDGNALYPRSSLLMRWLELCAIWCCSGWQTGMPRFSKLVREGARILAETLTSDDQKISFQRQLLALLWNQRDSTVDLSDWLINIYDNLLAEFITQSRTLNEEGITLRSFINRTNADKMTLGQFSGYGEGNDRVNLSTLHSAKGREFAVVFLFGMDNGRIPRNNISQHEHYEARRLFYVGFTRAETELHIMFTDTQPSPFVLEVQHRLKIGL